MTPSYQQSPTDNQADDQNKKHNLHYYPYGIAVVLLIVAVLLLHYHAVDLTTIFKITSLSSITANIVIQSTPSTNQEIHLRHLDVSKHESTLSSSNPLIYPASAQLGYCTHNSYLAGKWIYQSEKGDKDFHCCQRNNLDYLHNSTICGEHYYDDIVHPSDAVDVYSWEASIAGKASPIDGSQMGQYPLISGTVCDCDIENRARYHVSTHERYEWETSFCTLPKFNPKDFCDFVQHETVLFIGDYSMYQFYTTLMSLMSSQRQYSCISSWKYYAADYLSFETHKRISFMTGVRLMKPTMVFMSAGNVLGDLGDMDSVWGNVWKDIQVVLNEQTAQSQPLTQFVWIQQLLGQTNCGAMKNKPLTKYNNGIDRQENRGFQDKHEFDALVHKQIDVLREQNVRNYQQLHYIDLSPLWLRPDSKLSDCVYYCMPGPLSLVWRIVYNKLLTKEILPPNRKN